ncbi:hypothetical protein ACJX0J_035763, partial [Zea mays]
SSIPAMLPQFPVAIAVLHDKIWSGAIWARSLAGKKNPRQNPPQSPTFFKYRYEDVQTFFNLSCKEETTKQGGKRYTILCGAYDQFLNPYNTNLLDDQNKDPKIEQSTTRGCKTLHINFKPEYMFHTPEI